MADAFSQINVIVISENNAYNLANHRRGYVGIKCEIAVCFGKNATAEDVCSHRGICRAPNNCECKNGFSGRECERCEGMIIGNFCDKDKSWSTTIVIIISSSAFSIGTITVLCCALGLIVTMRKYPNARIWGGYKLINEKELKEYIQGKDLSSTTEDAEHQTKPLLLNEQE